MQGLDLAVFLCAGETVELTDELIRAGESRRGGYSARQLEVLGVSWPPVKGWKRDVIGKQIDAASYRRFLNLTRGKSGPDPRALNLF